MAPKKSSTKRSASAKTGEFTTRKVADEVVLRVDGVDYFCSPSAPSRALTKVLAARDTIKTMTEDGVPDLLGSVELIGAVENLLVKSMLPESRERYEERLEGATEEGGAIDLVDMISHGLWLVEAYLRRPTAQPGSSTISGAPTT